LYESYRGIADLRGVMPHTAKHTENRCHSVHSAFVELRGVIPYTATRTATVRRIRALQMHGAKRRERHGTKRRERHGTKRRENQAVVGVRGSVCVP